MIIRVITAKDRGHKTEAVIREAAGPNAGCLRIITGTGAKESRERRLPV